MYIYVYTYIHTYRHINIYKLYLCKGMGLMGHHEIVITEAEGELVDVRVDERRVAHAPASIRQHTSAYVRQRASLFMRGSTSDV